MEPLDKMSDQTNIPIEKLRIYERLLLIEQYILEGKELRGKINDTMSTLNLRCTNLENMIHGHDGHENKTTRDGINRRVETLELKDANVEKVKGSFLKVAVGSITMAVGAFMLWAIKLVWSSK